jgi:hypothetical protein
MKTVEAKDAERKVAVVIRIASTASVRLNFEAVPSHHSCTAA